MKYHGGGKWHHFLGLFILLLKVYAYRRCNLTYCIQPQKLWPRRQMLSSSRKFFLHIFLSEWQRHSTWSDLQPPRFLGGLHDGVYYEISLQSVLPNMAIPKHPIFGNLLKPKMLVRAFRRLRDSVEERVSVGSRARPIPHLQVGNPTNAIVAALSTD